MGYVFPSSSNEDDNNSNEVIVTLKIPKQYYEAGLIFSRLLGYSSLTEYLEYAVKDSIETKCSCRGNIDCSDPNNKAALDKAKIPRI